MKRIQSKKNIKLVHTKSTNYHYHDDGIHMLTYFYKDCKKQKIC